MIRFSNRRKKTMRRVVSSCRGAFGPVTICVSSENLEPVLARYTDQCDPRRPCRVHSQSGWR